MSVGHKAWCRVRWGVQVSYQLLDVAPEWEFEEEYVGVLAARFWRVRLYRRRSDARDAARELRSLGGVRVRVVKVREVVVVMGVD